MRQQFFSLRSLLSRFLTPRRLEIVVGLLATMLIGIGLLFYTLAEPDRIIFAQQAQQGTDLDEAMTLYAQNCAVCHGLAGEGISSIPPLNNPTLQTSDSQALIKIISRGLYGTAMPAWSIEDGGPLSNYQITELVMLVQNGDWQSTQDRVVNLGLAPKVPFTTQADPSILESVSKLPEGEQIAEGMTLYAQECVACHGADGLGSSLAPALNDPQVRAKTEAELLRTIQNGISGTLMASWKNALGEDQISALLALITRWDEVPEGAIPEPDRPIPVTEESLAMGADLYTQSCSRCHGPEGQGTQRAPSLNVKGFLSDTSDAALQQIITFGVSGTSMPAWGDRLSDVEIQAVVGFIRSWEPTAPEVAVPARGGGGPWWSTSGSQPGQQGSPGSGQSRGRYGRGGNANSQGAATLNTDQSQMIESPGVQSATPDPLSVVSTPQASILVTDGLADAVSVNQEQILATPGTSTQIAPTGTPMTGELTGANPVTAGHNQTGGGPPWAQPSTQESSLTSLNLLVDNWQSVGLLFGVLLVALFLFSIAVKGLRRLG
jgi:mono/diheme cytochrome c family protein